MHRPLTLDPRRWPRETRLLVVTIVLSLAVLLTLARFRFPAQQLTLPVQPLQQLAARAAFDDLGASVTRAVTLLRSSLVVVARAPAGGHDDGEVGPEPQCQHVIGRGLGPILAKHVFERQAAHDLHGRRPGDNHERRT